MSDEVFTEGGRLVKMEVDYSAAVDEKLPTCEKLAKVKETWNALCDGKCQ